MKNQNIIYLFIFITIVVLFGMGITVFMKSQSNLNSTKFNLKQNKLLIEKLENEKVMLVENDSYKINANLNLRCLKNDTVQINQLFGSKKTLVLFFSLDNCSDCYNYCLNVFNEFSSDINISNTVVLVAKFNVRDLYVFSKSNKFKSRMCCVDTLGLPIEKLNMPFMFILDESLIPSHVFIPRKENHDLTMRYFEIIKDVLLPPAGASL